MIIINDQIIGRFEANQSEWQCECEMLLADTNVLKIEHYGKNYTTDSDPDKYFELQRCWVNGVDLKHHLHRFQQTAYLAPWDDTSPPAHSLYLGHNGYLLLNFDAPVNQWIQTIFGVNQDTMHGQSTTRAVLEDVKQSFGF